MIADIFRNMSLKEDIFEDLIAHGYEKPSIGVLIKSWFSHPSLRLLINYRLARAIPNDFFGGSILKRFLWLNIVSKTGCHISPSAVLEPGVIFPHATGIVIGNNAHIKKGVKIFQNVTFAIEDEVADKAPTAQENAIIYAGAVVIGDITIGEGAVVGANSVLKINVPAGKSAVGAPAKIID